MTGRRADLVLAPALLLGAVMAVSVESGPPSLLALALAALVTAPVAFRRSGPVAAYTVSFAALMVSIGLGYPHEPLLPALITVLYAVLVATPRRIGLVIAAASGAVLSAVALATGVLGPVPVVGSFGWLGLAVAAAEIVRSRRADAAHAEERARRAERLAAEEAAHRVAAERLRIARELHDVLSHGIAVISAQAAVARHLEEPAGQAAALAIIDDTARDTMGGLRAALGVLRDGEDETFTPAPGLDGLRALVDRAGEAGLTVALRVSVEAGPPPAVGLCAYRIVQESLTNAAKHAPGSRVEVEVERLPDRLRLRIADDGPPGPAPGPGPGTGSGIIGMTERATALGGALHAGPRRGTGFEVRADLPC